MKLTEIPAWAKRIENENYSDIKFTFCTLVTQIDQYTRFLNACKTSGFTEDDCEFTYVDNTQSNVHDAYSGLNLLLSRARGNYIILCHQDVLFEDNREKLEQCLTELDTLDSNWAVAGNAGYDSCRNFHVRITDRFGINVRKGSLPAQVISLDENFLILRAECRLGFSTDLSGFHLYGTDLVTQALLRGHTSYAIDFLLEHVGEGNADLRYFDCLTEFQKKYTKAFKNRPIKTTVAKTYLGVPSLASRLNYIKICNSYSSHYSFYAIIRKLQSWLRSAKFNVYEAMFGPRYNIDGVSYTIPHQSPLAARKAMIRGTYEIAERRLIRKWMPKNLPTVELGGSYGIVSNVVRKCLAPNQKLVIVEAIPSLVEVCRQNAGLGPMTGEVTVVNAAISYDGTDTVRFEITEGIHTSKIATGEVPNLAECIEIRALTLKTLLNDHNIFGDFTLICDIEGTEYDLFSKESKDVMKHCACIIAELHPEVFYKRGVTVGSVLKLITDNGLTIVDCDQNVVAAVRK